MSEQTQVSPETQALTDTAEKPVVLKSFSGEVQSWNLGNDDKTGRDYIVINSNWARIRKIVKTDLFKVNEGSGEQRSQKKAHVRKLMKVISTNNFTPTVFYASVRDHHDVSFNKRSATVKIHPEAPLPLIDGGHRYAALEELRKESMVTQRKIDNLPVTMMVMLNSTKTAEDFLNLQEGCPVDKNHMLSLKIGYKMIDEKKSGAYTLALDIAKLLHESPVSPLYKMIQFDTLGDAPLKFSSIATSHASDLATSLFGLAKVAERGKKDAEWAAGIVILTYEHLRDNHKNLLAKGKLLCPPPDGSKGGAGLLIGISNLIAYRLIAQERDLPKETDYKAFDNALSVFDDDVDGNLNITFKRRLMGDFADLLFSDLANAEGSVIATHDGVPISLLVLFSTSAFNVSKLPKAPKNPKKGKNVVAPAVNGASPPSGITVDEEYPDGKPIENTTDDSDTTEGFFDDEEDEEGEESAKQVDW